MGRSITSTSLNLLKRCMLHSIMLGSSLCLLPIKSVSHLDSDLISFIHVLAVDQRVMTLICLKADDDDMTAWTARPDQDVHEDMHAS